MMSNIKYFDIDGKALFLDKTLIDFNMLPVFFVCKDDNDSYYICLCTDFDEFYYIVVESSIDEIYRMLDGKITMRDVFLKKDYFYNIQSYNDLEYNEVKKMDIVCIDKDELPYEGEYYEILSQSDQEYKEKIRRLLESKDFGFKKYSGDFYTANADTPVGLNDYKPKTWEVLIKYNLSIKEQRSEARIIGSEFVNREKQIENKSIDASFIAA